MGQLHELLAARQKLDTRAEAALRQLRQIFKGPQLFEGLLQTYRHLEEDPSGLHREPPKTSNMVTTVPQVLAEVREEVGPLYDLLFQIDKTNMAAVGSVKVGGLTLESVPTTHLLQLEKNLEKLKEALADLPVHDAKYQWEGDQERGQGVYKTDPQITYRTTKKMRYEVVVQPTQHHPAQVKEFTEDVVTGEVTKLHWSGKSTVKDKNILMKRLDDLLVAIKKAIAAANRVEHETDELSGKVFDYLFGHYGA